MANRSLSGAKINVQLQATVNNLMNALSQSASGSTGLTYAQTLQSGVGSLLVDRAWSYSALITNNTTLTIGLSDLAALDAGAGPGNDVCGQAWSAAQVVAILIQNLNAIETAGSLEIQPGVAHPFNPIGIHTVANGGALKGQGILLKYQPASSAWIIDDTDDEIKLGANGADVTFGIMILARSDIETSSSSSSLSSSSSASSTSSSSQSSSSSSSKSSASSNSSSSSSSSSSSRSSRTSSSSSSSSSKSSMTSSSSSSSRSSMTSSSSSSSSSHP